MMNPAKTEHRAELDRLLSAFCDGQLDEAGQSRIAEILQGDPEARRYYLQFLDLHMDLSRRADIGKIVPFSTLGGGRKPVPRMRWVATAAAAAIVGAAVAWGVFGSGNRERDPSPSVANISPPAAIAYVTRAEGVSWDGVSAEPSLGLQLKPGRVELNEGRLRVDLFDGTGVTFEAPSSFELHANGGITLAAGRMAVDRPSGADDSDFSVRTPSAMFVDIGTVFAVTVNDERTSQLRVIEGEVYTALLDASGNSLQEHSSFEGDYLVADAERGLAEAELDPSDFATMLNPAVVPLPISADYVAAIERGKPIAYWRFESENAGEVSSVVGATRPAKLLGNAHIEGRPSNQMLHLDADDPDRGAFVDDGFEKLNENGEYSIELWMNPESADWSGLASLVELPELDLDALSKARSKHRLAAIECMPQEPNRWAKGEPRTVSFFHRLSSRDWGDHRGEWKNRGHGDSKKGDDRDWPRWPRDHDDDDPGNKWGDKDWAPNRSGHDKGDHGSKWKDKDWARNRGGQDDHNHNDNHEKGWDRDRNGQVFSRRLYEPGSWHHVVAVREQDRVALYIGGELAASTPLAPTTDTKEYDLIIGRYSLAGNWIGRPFAGHIDEVAVYDRALTAAEVKSHFELIEP